jgi:excisionase family DNA binding protein
MTASVEEFLAAFSDDLAEKVAEKLLAGLPAPDRLLSVEQTAERLGVKERTVRGLKADGKLAYVMIGGAVRFEASAVEAYLASRRVAAT